MPVFTYRSAAARPAVWIGMPVWFCCALLGLLWLLPRPTWAQKPLPPAFLDQPEQTLHTYRQHLTTLRIGRPPAPALPTLSFYLFGMGNRQPFIYRNGRLLDALTGHIEEQWNVARELIIPSEYTVHLELAPAADAPGLSMVQIREDENGVWILQTGKRPRLLAGTRSHLNLPRFAQHLYGSVLRVLHQEVLINIKNGRPLPNFLVYDRPRYQDAALMGMVLRETENLDLIRDWITQLRDPFDRHGPGPPDPANLGQVLFLASLVANSSHPVVSMVLDSTSRFRRGTYLTDSTGHAVFQTKWLKFGLQSLGLPDSYVIPARFDPYSSLFWYAYTEQHVAGESLADADSATYPYAGWANDHFYRRATRQSAPPSKLRGLVSPLDYPLSWQVNEPDAHYPALTPLDKGLVRQKIAFPYARHAAEMFLFLKQ